MLVSTVKLLITVIESIAIDDFESAEVVSLLMFVHYFVDSGKAFLFCGPSRNGIRGRGHKFRNRSSAANERETVPGFHLGDELGGVLFEFLDGHVSHGLSLSGDSTLGRELRW